MIFRLLPSLLILTLAGCADKSGNATVARAADAATVQPAAAAGVAPPPSSDSSAALLAKADAGRILGNPAATTWVIIISDFQCPFCKSWHDETWDAIRKEFVDAGKIRVAYVNLPLPMHANAVPAAEAAMCASVQGKFWPMQDALFRTQKSWADLSNPLPFFESLARDAGADVNALRACVASKATRPLIQGDEERASRAGAQSTPTFFVGSQPLVGAQPLATFRGAIQAALASKPAGQ